MQAPDRDQAIGPLALALITLMMLVGCTSAGPDSSVLLDRLSQPRGIGIDGSTVCLAEAGSIPPTGPAVERNGQQEADTGRVLRSDDGASFRAVATDLPFVYYPDAAVTSGTSDVLCDEETTVVLIGESFGELSRSVVRISETGPVVIADLLAFAQTRAPGGEDVLRSNPWSILTNPYGDGFLVADAATGEILSVDLSGDVELFAPVPGHEVLTGMARGLDGVLYVASFGQLPHPRNSGGVIAVDADGSSRTIVDDLTMTIDVGFDDDGGLLVLEYAAPTDEPLGVDAYRDETGRLLYLPDPADPSERFVLLDDLNRPTALGINADTVLISISGGEQARAQGEVREYSLDRLRSAVLSD